MVCRIHRCPAEPRMGLDYSQGCVNFRDVGECINLLAEEDLLPLGRILRGGKLDHVETAEQIGSPGSIINLRNSPDFKDRRFGADHWQFGIPNEHEKYDTTQPLVRQWLVAVLGCLAEDVVRFPVLLHCTSGKDRTGVVVAALLGVLGIDRELIVREYLWSEGGVERRWIETALDGIGDPAACFRRIDLPALKTRLLGR